MKADLSGQTILVTGAGGDLGRTVTTACARAGARVAAFIHHRPAGPEAFFSISADLREPAAVRAAFDALDAAAPRLDGWVHCAGIGTDRLLPRMGDETIQDTLAVNLSSALHCARHLLPRLMRSGGGSMVLIGSLAALRPEPGQAAYAAAKGGLESLARALAREAAPKGIRANCLAPGFLDSARIHALHEPVRSSLLERIPLRRWGTLNEVAETCTFLLSSQAAYVTGQILRIDGGAGA